MTQIGYQVVDAINPMRDNPLDGLLYDDAMENMEFSNALGDGIKKIVSNVTKNAKARQDARAKRKQTKADAKLVDANSRIAAANTLTKDDGSAAILAATMKKGKAAPEKDNTMLYVGLGLLGLLVVGGIITMVVLKNKKGKGK